MIGIGYFQQYLRILVRWNELTFRVCVCVCLYLHTHDELNYWKVEVVSVLYPRNYVL